MVFSGRWTRCCLLLAALALLAGVAHANMEVVESYSSTGVGYNGYTFSVSTNLPANQVLVLLSLTQSTVSGSGLTLLGWDDNSARGQYAFRVSMNAFTIRDSSFMINKGVPADSIIEIAGTQVLNADTQTPPFDFSSMFFVNNITLNLENSYVALTGSSRNQPIIAAGGSGGNTVFDYYTSVQVVGMSSSGGACVLSLPSSRSAQASIAITDHAVVSVSSVAACGLRDGVLCVADAVYIAQSSLLRVLNVESRACQLVDTLDTELNRAPATVVRSDTGDFSLAQASTMLIKNVYAPDSSAVEGYSGGNSVTGVALDDDCTLSVLNITTKSFCATCTSGVPTSSTSSSLVYASDWTIDGTRTTDYDAQNLGNAVPLDTTGHVASGQCGQAECLRANVAGASTSATCACNCKENYFGRSCMAKVDRGTAASSCTVADCILCPLSASQCSGCRAGFAIDAAGACVRVPCAVEHCATCSDRSPNVCIDCIPGYGITASGQCAACANPYCLKCDSNTAVCTQCASGYTLKDDTCVATSDLCNVPNCDTCVDNNVVKCEKCKAGYGLSATGTCVRCTDPNCKQCDGNADKCASCADGYFLTQYGTCSPGGECALPNCAYCDAKDQSKCTNCINGYIVDSDSGKCVPTGTCLVENCLQCVPTSPNVCSKCATNYVLDVTTGKCTAESGACKVANCAQCVSGNANKCKTCKPNYSLTSTGLCSTGACRVYYCAQCEPGNPERCRVCKSGYGITTLATCVAVRTTVSPGNGSNGPVSLLVAGLSVVVSAVLFVL